MSSISPAKFLTRKYNIPGNRQIEEVENANTTEQSYNVAYTTEHELSQETTLRKICKI